MASFILENVSVPPEVEAAIDKRSSMAAVGNLNDYVKYQMAQGLEQGGTGVGGLGAELAVGASIAQQMMNAAGRHRGAGAPPAAAPGARPRGGRCRRRSARRTRRRLLGVVGGRRRREPRSGRSEGQEDRHPVADHDGGDRASSCRLIGLRAHRADRPIANVAAREKFACPACGADAHWNPAKQALVCPFCGTESPATLADARRRDGHRRARPGRGAARDAGRPPRMAGRRSLGQVSELPGNFGVRSRAASASGASSADRRSSCRTSRSRSRSVPSRCCRSRSHESQARDLIRAWYGRQWLAPNNLTKRALTDTVRGVYLPYWTFDAQVHASWTADCRPLLLRHDVDGKREQRVRVDAGVRASSITSSTTSWCAASHGVSAGAAAPIEPFPTGELIPYDPGYLAGWTVERYQIDLVERAARSRERWKRSSARCAAARCRATRTAT